VNNLLSIADIKAGIPAEFRSFFQIVKLNPDLITLQLAESFWHSIALFGRVSRLSKPCKIILDTSPFCIDLGVGKLSFLAEEKTYHIAIENIVFLDIKKAAMLPQNFQIATFLEEFVHALMDVEDEDLTSKIVAAIYPGIKYVDGKYTWPLL